MPARSARRQSRISGAPRVGTRRLGVRFRIGLEVLRGEESISELCRREGIMELAQKSPKLSSRELAVRFIDGRKS
jgi:hypothetical protein